MPVRPKGDHHHITQWLELREIRVNVGRKGHRSQKLLLWTSLLESHEFPAMELAQMYAQRWQHELYYRELKKAIAAERCVGQWVRLKTGEAMRC